MNFFILILQDQIFSHEDRNFLSLFKINWLNFSNI